jgi:hypothetical protein
MARGPSALLAARRLSDNPKGAFRTSSGVVLAVFAASLVACIVPAFRAAQSKGAAAQLTNVLKVPLGNEPFSAGLDPKTGGQLVSYLDSQTGVTAVPIYANPSGSTDSVVSCSAIRALPALGSCAPGVTAVQAAFSELLGTDNPIYFNRDLPAVSHSSAPAAESPSGLPVSALLVKTNTPDALERVRT